MLNVVREREVTRARPERDASSGGWIGLLVRVQRGEEGGRRRRGGLRRGDPPGGKKRSFGCIRRRARRDGDRHVRPLRPSRRRNGPPRSLANCDGWAHRHRARRAGGRGRRRGPNGARTRSRAGAAASLSPLTDRPGSCWLLRPAVRERCAVPAPLCSPVALQCRSGAYRRTRGALSAACRVYGDLTARVRDSRSIRCLSGCLLCAWNGISKRSSKLI